LTTLASDTAYHSFAGEVEARTPPRYAAFIPSARHQLSRIAPAQAEPSCLMIWVGTTTILSDRSRLTPSSLPSRASGFVQWGLCAFARRSGGDTRRDPSPQCRPNRC